MNALAGKIVPALAAVTAGASALAVLGNLLVSNYEKITPAGDVVMKPTKQETDLQSSKTGASSNDMQPNSRLMRIPQMLLLQI